MGEGVFMQGNGEGMLWWGEVLGYSERGWDRGMLWWGKCWVSYWVGEGVG